MTKGQEEADDEAVGEDEGSAAAYLHADGPATAGQSTAITSCHRSETRSTRTQRGTIVPGTFQMHFPEFDRETLAIVHNSLKLDSHYRSSSFSFSSS